MRTADDPHATSVLMKTLQHVRRVESALMERWLVDR
jgi:hypothetical protein